MHKFVDLSGQIFGRLTVASRTGSTRYGGALWLCHCECGKDAVVRSNGLLSGGTLSCGCLRGLVRSGRNSHHYKHGQSKSPEHRAWAQAKTRCFNPRCDKYAYYGGRGITMCEEWRNDFAAFLRDVGPRPSPAHTLDRFPNVDGNYEKGNVRWATQSEQCNNTRRNHLVEFRGERHTLTEWERRLGLGRSVLWHRIMDLGWPVERALTTGPVIHQ